MQSAGSGSAEWHLEHDLMFEASCSEDGACPEDVTSSWSADILSGNLQEPRISGRVSPAAGAHGDARQLPRCWIPGIRLRQVRFLVHGFHDRVEYLRSQRLHASYLSANRGSSQIDGSSLREELEGLCEASASEEKARQDGLMGTEASRADGLHSLLHLIADVYHTYPNLWLDPNLRSD